MAARKRNWTPDIVRQRIRVAMLINRLQNHVAGKLAMTATQVQAANILMRKILPDMIAQTIEHKPLESMADEELLNTLAALRGVIAAQPAGTGAEDAGKPTAVAPVSTLQ